MPFDHPSLILTTLDRHLGHAVELTVFGKAALWFGFDGVPDSYGATIDVDAIVPADEEVAELFARAKPAVLALASNK